MIEVKPQPPEKDLDKRAWEVFTKAIELAGGPRQLIEHRRLTWLPSLMEAAYAIILKEEGHKTADEIASFLGLGKQSVRNILQASTEAVLERLKGENPDEDNRTHIAGGLAKLAYKALQNES